MQAIILAGGKGTRLAARLAGKPKPLVDVGGIPLLERQIRTLESHGVDDVVVLVNHAADQIHAFFASQSFEAKVQIVDDGDPSGTAGAALASLDLMASRVMIVYGDTLFDIDIAHMLAAHEAAAADVTLLLHPNDHPADSDLVAVGCDGMITGFHPHPHPPGADLRNLVNAAFYIVEKQALTRWHDMPVPSDFAQDLFPAMLAAGQRLFGYISAEYIKDLGTPSRLDTVERHLAAGLVARASRRETQRAVFIDRDGTLNVPHGHIADPANVVLLPGAAEGVRRLNDAGLRTVLVTNQPVIARGEADYATVERIHGRLESLLSTEGAYLDRIYVCPHHPDAGYPGEVAALKMTCRCRKPAPGMIEDAIDALNIDRHRSWMVGDSDADILAANRAGLLSVRVRTGETATGGGVSDAVAPDFAAAARTIVDAYPRLLDEAGRHVAYINPGDVVLIAGEDSDLFAAVLRNELRAAKHHAVTLPPGVSMLPPEDYTVEKLAEWFAGAATELSMPAEGLVLPKDATVILSCAVAIAPPRTVRPLHRILHAQEFGR